jgi:hypothetical protein
MGGRRPRPTASSATPAPTGLGGMDSLAVGRGPPHHRAASLGFRPGGDFVVRMRDGLETADRTLAVISAAYLPRPTAPMRGRVFLQTLLHQGGLNQHAGHD